jgi:sirohydrochlorin cobaltochelatase
LTGDTDQFGVLIAAHGGRDVDRSSNESIFKLAEKVAARIGGVRVAVGFINGIPAIGEAMRGVTVQNLLVYPLFMADGYFGQTVLNRVLEHARQEWRGGSIATLPPLGVDPALADLVVAKAASAAAAFGVPLDDVTLVLLAHGSTRGRASAIAAKQIAKNALANRRFADVRVAFLDEAPSLETTVSGIDGPAVVVGLFSGDGLHGGNDSSRLMAGLDRNDVIYVGNAGLFSGLEELVATAIKRAMAAAEPAAVG